MRIRIRRPSLLAACAALAACGDGATPPRVCEVEADLQPGGVLVTDPSVDEPGCGLFLPAGQAGDRYRVALLRPDSAAANSSPAVTLRMERVEAAASPAPPGPSPAPAPGTGTPPEAMPLPPGMESGDATGAFHHRLRADEEQMVARLGTRGLLASVPEGPLRAALAPSPGKLAFDVGTSCSSARSTRTGVLVGENQVMAIYQDSVELSTQRVSEGNVQRMLSFFSSYGKETVESYSGALPDVDGNGKVTVFASRAAFSDASVVAYVWAGNFYERESCPASDEAEVVFFNPARIHSMDGGEYVALGVLSHESQHLVSLYHRLARTRRRGSGTFLSHPSWIEEGRAELADEVTSRRAWSAVGGPARTAAVTGQDFLAYARVDGRCCRPEAFGVALETARTIWYLSSQPNGLAVAPTGGIPETDIRNGGWHFHRWLGDAYGGAGSAPGGDAALFRSLTDSLTASGREGLEAVLGRPFEELLEGFASAVMLHRVAGGTPARGFATYDFVSLTTLAFSGAELSPPGAYPWPVTTTGTSKDAVLTRPFESAAWTGPIGPTGIRIHDFLSDGTGAGALLTVAGMRDVRLVVVRVR